MPGWLVGTSLFWTRDRHWQRLFLYLSLYSSVLFSFSVTLAPSNLYFFYSYRRFVLSSESGCRNQLGFRFIFVKFQTPKSSTLIALMDLRVWITRHVVNSLTDHSAAVLCHTLCAVRTTSTAALLDIGITTPQLSCYLKCHVGGMWLSYIVT